MCWATGSRSVGGGRVGIAVPERGAKRKLMDTVAQNARDHFQRHKLKRASDFGARSRALAELGAVLGLEQAPLRIECYDISNLGPTDKVGSMVVFEDGLPKRSDYRRFQIKGVAGQDDFASMDEMLRRRFARLRAEAKDRAIAKPRRFAYPPSLVVVDGGRGQLAVASEGARRRRSPHPRDRPGQAPGGGLLPGPAGSAARSPGARRRSSCSSTCATKPTGSRSRTTDRSGRGARSRRRSTRSRASVRRRKKALLKRFGSLARLSRATPEEIAETPGIGPELAHAIHERLHVAGAERRESA